jgi:hypothetical protein
MSTSERLARPNGIVGGSSGITRSNSSAALMRSGMRIVVAAALEPTRGPSAPGRRGSGRRAVRIREPL